MSWGNKYYYLVFSFLNLQVAVAANFDETTATTAQDQVEEERHE